MIDRGAAERIEAWLQEASRPGRESPGGRPARGHVWQPTVLAVDPRGMRVSCQEVFAPLVGPVSLQRRAWRPSPPWTSSDFGLQAGLFTNDWNLIQTAFDRIEVGGLMVNDVSTFRVDHMPYGGVKKSGSGREGLRYAIEEMTEMKLLMFQRTGS